MKSLTHTMIALLAFNLGMGSLIFAQDSSDEKTPACILSGTVGVPGVEMQGLPGDPIYSDEHGLYSVTVEGNWSGTVRPSKEGLVFQPPERIYDINVTHWPKGKAGPSFTNQDYVPHVVADDGSRSRVTWQFAGNRWEPTYPSGSRRVGRSAGYQPATASVSSRRVLVVPSGEIKAEEIAEITEDMQVMSHILDERFKQTRRVQGLFTDFGDFFGRDNRQTEAIYLQGYGVLFSMEVNFTFSPPAEPAAQPTEKPAENVDPTWQQAQREVFRPGAAQRPATSESTEEQGQRMVEELKSDLIATLKHAANIRGLQPDEWVILTVIGSGRTFGGMGGMGMMGGGMGMGGASYSAGGSGFGGGSSDSYGGGMAMGGGFSRSGSSSFGGGMGMGGMGGSTSVGPSSATVLTIRAKKSDVDAFAKDNLSTEQFQEKVKTVMY